MANREENLKKINEEQKKTDVEVDKNEEILSEDELNAVAGGDSAVKFGGISRTPVIVNCD